MPETIQKASLSVVIPCYNEIETLEACVDRVLQIHDDTLDLEIILIDDCSTDGSADIIDRLAEAHDNISAAHHPINKGKGAALRTGFQLAAKEFVAIQDADLEYDPEDLKRLLVPLVKDSADVVFGSRFLTGDPHRVLYFWHSLGNKFLTLLSNMFSDLNLTDMECCYKLFRREVIQNIRIEEKRFGVEPELVAKVAQLRLRIFEMGISYSARTYEEGKKIGYKDGLRALYCIFHYNAPKAPLPVQFLIYFLIGGFAAFVNVAGFFLLYTISGSLYVATPLAFATAWAFNYILCIAFLFRHRAKWDVITELLAYAMVGVVMGGVDFLITVSLSNIGLPPVTAKFTACIFGLVCNFAGRRFLVFPETAAGPWKPQLKKRKN